MDNRLAFSNRFELLMQCKKLRHICLYYLYYKLSNRKAIPVFYIQVVYTKENETADSYIEGLIAQIGSSYQVRVATSDAMVQLSSLRSGVLRMSARELQEELISTQKEMQLYFKNNKK